MVKTRTRTGNLKVVTLILLVNIFSNFISCYKWNILIEQFPSKLESQPLIKIDNKKRTCIEDWLNILRFDMTCINIPSTAKLCLINVVKRMKELTCIYFWKLKIGCKLKWWHHPVATLCVCVNIKKSHVKQRQ